MLCREAIRRIFKVKGLYLHHNVIVTALHPKKSGMRVGRSVSSRDFMVTWFPVKWPNFVSFTWSRNEDHVKSHDFHVMRIFMKFRGSSGASASPNNWLPCITRSAKFKSDQYRAWSTRCSPGRNPQWTCRGSRSKHSEARSSWTVASSEMKHVGQFWKDESWVQRLKTISIHWQQ